MYRSAIVTLLCLASFESIQADEKKKQGRLHDKPLDRKSWVPLAVPTPPTVVPAEPAIPAAPEGTRWVKSFGDEFEGDTLDTKKWHLFDNHARKGGFWLKKCVHLDGKGKLHLRVDREKDPKTGEIRKIAGGIDTRNRFEQRHGYFVCRYKMLKQNGHGYHSSFWLQSMSMSDVTGDGRNGTEIDIIEKFKFDHTIQHSLYWDGYEKDLKQTKLTLPWPGIDEGYHTYGLVWTEDQYEFYVDGVKTWTTDAGGVSQVPAFVRMTIEFSEGWNGNITNAKLPDECIIDWIRVYHAEEIPKPSTSSK